MLKSDIYKMYSELLFLSLKTDLGVKVSLKFLFQKNTRRRKVDGAWIPGQVMISLSPGCLKNYLRVEDIAATLIHEMCHQIMWNSLGRKMKKIDSVKYVGDANYRRRQEVQVWRKALIYAKKLGYWGPKFEKVMKWRRNGREAIESFIEEDD